MINDDLLDDLTADIDLDLLTELLSAEPEDISSQSIERQEGSTGPLSFQQHRLWLHQQLDSQSNAYNVPRAYHLQGHVEVAKLTEALQRVIDKHEILRTQYQGYPTPTQTIVEYKVQLECIDIVAFKNQDIDAQAVLTHPDIARWVAQPFDLACKPSIRVAWVAQDIGGILLLCNHHIASDAWSKPIFLKDLVGAYLGQTIAELPLRYLDYAHWQQAFLEGKQGEGALTYWREYIDKQPETLCCNMFKQAKAMPLKSQAIKQKLDIDVQQRAQIIQYCQHHALTLSSFFITVLQATLSSLSSTQNFFVGVPTAGRNHPQVGEIMGCFVNTQVYKNAINPERSLLDAAKANQRHTLSILEHDLIPYEWLAEQLNWSKEENRHDYFQVMFNYVEENKSLELASSLNISPLGLAQLQAKFELAVDVMVSEFHLTCWIEADSRYYELDFVNQLTQLFSDNVSVLMHCHGEQPFGAMSICRPDVEQSLLALGKGQGSDESAMSLLDSIAYQSRQNEGAKIALSAADASLTYAQLWQQVELGAQALLYAGLRTGDVVAIDLSSKLQQAITALAVLRACGTWVMLAADLPATRLQSIQVQTRCQLIISDDRTQIDTCLPSSVQYLSFKQLNDKVTACVLPKPDPRQVAYIIFTSGSTGEPKGVAVSHQALSAHLSSIAECFAYQDQDTGLCFASLGFDAGLEQLFVPLTQGADVVLVEGKDCTPEQLNKLINVYEISVVDLPPSYLHHCEDLGSVRVCIVGGEGWHQAHFAQAKLRFPKVQFFNAYGPTEAVISPALWQVPIAQQQIESTYAPIGQAVGLRQLYVLDTSLRLVPEGVIGELFIAGHLAQGYIGKPALTAERFIANPFTNTGTRLYRTGDIVRWQNNGQLEYLNRADSQVKVRGFRVELGEIETQLNALPGVSSSVVVAQENAGITRLVAYVVSDIGDSELLKAALAEHVVDYMVPSYIVHLEQLPLNNNGKVDRKSLPAINIESTQVYEAPINELEQTLANIWQTLLGVEQVGRADNFFALGGHSLILIQLHALIKEAGYEASVEKILKAKSLAHMAKGLQRADELNGFTPVKSQIVPGLTKLTPAHLDLVNLSQTDIDQIVARIPGGLENIQDIYPLAALQQSVLFIHQLTESQQNDPYLAPMLFTVKNKTSLDNFIAGLEFLAARHDALRTAVIWRNLAQPVQVLMCDVALQVNTLTLSKAQPILAQMQALIYHGAHWCDIEQAPMISIDIAQNEHAQYHVLLKMHHLICDHVTLDIISKELQHFVAGTTAQLPSIPKYRDFIAYQQFVNAKREPADFFGSLVKDIESPCLPFNLTDTFGLDNDIRKLRFELTKAQSVQIRTLAKQLQISAAAIFHAMWALVVKAGAQQEKAVFGTVMSGRLQGVDNVDLMLGMFINTLPFVIDVNGPSTRQFVETINTRLLSFVSYEQVALTDIQKLSGLQSNQPLFSSILNYRHTHRPNAAVGQDEQNITLVESNEYTNFPLGLCVDDYGVEFPFAMTLQLDSQMGIERMATYTQTALDNLLLGLDEEADGLQVAPSLISVLPQTEITWQTDVLGLHNQTVLNSNPVHELVQQQTLRTPHEIAAVCQGVSISYAQLDSRSTALAHHLLSDLNLENDAKIGITCVANVDYLVTILAVLKVGAAYVPIDANLPQARVAFICEDASLSALLSVDMSHNMLFDLPCPQLSVADLLGQTTNKAATSLPKANPQALMYIIYTSGTSGEPKGVSITHSAFVHFAQANNQAFAYTEHSNIFNTMALSFDAGNGYLLCGLLTGACVHFGHQPYVSCSVLFDYIERHQISHAHFTAAMLEPSQIRQVKSLCKVGTGGGVFNPEVLNKLSGAQLINCYGPTETTVASHFNPVTQPNGAVIGKNHDYAKSLVLSATGQLVPQGVIGELYISGPILAQGYHGKTYANDAFKVLEHTQLNLISNDNRWYKTGDLVRLLENGELEFVCRVDEQVKVRGYRIELQEIENQLLAIDGVESASVITNEQTSQLLGFVVLRKESALSSSSIKAKLSKHLPEYMLPNHLTILDEITLTTRGKVDKQALKKVKLCAQKLYQPPQTVTELQVAKIWQSFLPVEQISREDNFFDIGGESMMAMNILHRIQEQLPHIENMQVKQLWDTPVLAQFCQVIDGN
ncbi:amino acid adenylation domain-containing protein [Pseudoalteromonas neustonica]|uniref:Amino acid adenylation domain-containing protein n=1 Tax=Pseudoalteromonas neustonica TaxID=1840331 RepID=A0ABU9U018_9GAMM